MKRADEVLSLDEVQPGLAAHAAVHHGQQRRGDLDEADSAHEGGGGETGGVADRASAHRDDEARSIEPGSRHRPDHAFPNARGLGPLPVGQEQDPSVLETGLVQSRLNGGPVVLHDARRRHHDSAWAFAKATSELGMGKDARSDEDIVGSPARRDTYASHSRASVADGRRGRLARRTIAPSAEASREGRLRGALGPETRPRVLSPRPRVLSHG